MDSLPGGVLSPVLTPFDGQLLPDVRRWVEHCEWLLASGCSGLAIFGTTSEANSLSVEERESLLSAILEDGVPASKLLPGTGCCAFPDTVRLTRRAVQAGCTGVLMLPPFYYKSVSDDGLFASYAAVIDRVADARLRVYLYHIPQVSGAPISLRVIERLRATYPQIVVGMKDSSGDWNNSKAVLEAFPGFRLFVGSERFLLANLRAGGVGCITATANVNAAAIDRLYRAWQSSNAQKLQDEIDRVRNVFERFGAIPAMKSTLAHYRNDSSWRRLRPPLTELSPERHAELISSLEAAGFAGLR